MTTPTLTTSLRARRHSLLVRIHLWSALIATPLVVIAALTGLLYLFTPQIEAVLYDHLDHVAVGGVPLALDRQVAAAVAAAPPGATLQAVAPAFADGDTTAVSFAPAADGHAGHAATPPKAGALVVYVDPANARVTGQLARHERFGNWSKNLHSRLLQTNGWRWIIELAASVLLVMLLTGVLLWWPQPGKTGMPQKSATGRTAWKQWHGFIGAALMLLTLMIVVTGLTWSEHAGGQIRALRDLSGQGPTPPPRHLQSGMTPTAAPLTWQAAADLARARAPEVAIELRPPVNKQGVWRANATTRGAPLRQFDLRLDAFSGATLYYAGWDQQTLFGKATAIGIPFHRGEFGWWNQALLLLFDLGVLFSVASGWVIFFGRWRAGAALMPRWLPGTLTSVPLAGWIALLALCALMPLLAITVVLVALLELGGAGIRRGVQ
ncbi:putative iron-regulated membrane protein [Actimicrobium sp. GrIS 1.19]|uniref:PepSY-associated TM helix domain-containing protein n=1 Tax=Actimicrobium sp. GrIS 1.19 TaxID=3071708 RepID=UPI002E06A5D3|nr:putative iron-regulated membrane protein [Actimicrobium sp. GrIS 1.19]